MDKIEKDVSINLEEILKKNKMVHPDTLVKYERGKKETKNRVSVNVNNTNDGTGTSIQNSQVVYHNPNESTPDDSQSNPMDVGDFVQRLSDEDHGTLVAFVVETMDEGILKDLMNSTYQTAFNVCSDMFTEHWYSCNNTNYSNDDSSVAASSGDGQPLNEEYSFSSDNADPDENFVNTNVDRNTGGAVILHN